MPYRVYESFPPLLPYVLLLGVNLKKVKVIYDPSVPKGTEYEFCRFDVLYAMKADEETEESLELKASIKQAFNEEYSHVRLVGNV